MIVTIQAVLAILLIFSILMQQRAAGLGNASGGTGGAYVQRRGAEKFLFNAAIGLAVAMFLLTILDWFF